MQCLSPLVIGLLMAMAAVLGIRESSRLQEIVPLHGGIAGHRDIPTTETEFVSLANLVGVSLAHLSFFRTGVLGTAGGAEKESRGRAKQYAQNENAPCEIAHGHRWGRGPLPAISGVAAPSCKGERSEEDTSELQSPR